MPKNYPALNVVMVVLAVQTNNMTPKEFVLQHYPNAECENEHPDYWIWSNEQSLFPFILGDSAISEEYAWEDAKNYIENNLVGNKK